MDDIVTSTRSYERWLASQTRIVARDLRLKHARLRESPFVFLRGTFYRWVERWRALSRAVSDAPRILSVGDLHIENFGTWRDIEGRLVWGVNDVDEATPLPYTNDLTRLATSALLAVGDRHFALNARAACEAILEGYRAALERGGRPVVLAERRVWLRTIALGRLRDPVTYWEKMLALPSASGTVPRRVLSAAMPDPHVEWSARRRAAGVGSLGRQRYVALANWNGGWIAREAKALVPSAAAWAGAGDASATHCDAIVRNAIRDVDPFYAARNGWIVRRLAPDCSRIELTDLPARRDERKLLRAMGWETANVHLGAGSRAADRIRRDVNARPDKWLGLAAEEMAAATREDWTAWRRSTPRQPK